MCPVVGVLFLPQGVGLTNRLCLRLEKLSYLNHSWIQAAASEVKQHRRFRTETIIGLCNGSGL